MILTQTDNKQSTQVKQRYLMQPNDITNLFNPFSNNCLPEQTINDLEQFKLNTINQSNYQGINTNVMSSPWQKFLVKTHEQNKTQIVEQLSHEIDGKKNTISIYDMAQEVKNNFLKQYDIFLDQISQLDDQFYQTSEFFDQYHPNCLAERCIENIKQVTHQVQTTIMQIDQASGNTIKTKFHSTESIQCSKNFTSVQGLGYQVQNIKKYLQTVVAYDFSIQDRFLACCYNNTIALFDMVKQQDISKIIHQRKITAIKYYEDESLNFIVGDIDGFIALYNSHSLEQLQENELHRQTICQIFIKDNSKIFTSSLDNTIKLTNIIKFEILLTIIQTCSCFSGFDYSNQNNFLIAPNNLSFLSIWDGSTGQEIITKSLDFEEDQFIAIQLSSDSKQVLVNLFKLYTILLFEIKYDLKELLLIKEIELHHSVEKCINFQWCLDDTSFIYFHQSSFEIRSLEQKNIPLIFQEFINTRENYYLERGFVNKLNKDLNYLVAIFDDEVQIYKKRKQRSQCQNQYIGGECFELISYYSFRGTNFYITLQSVK
ncbi:hypothetical protein pb186bvf_002743 [Paramecium bursaria]